MNDTKSWGSTVLGWFVVRDGGPSPDPEPLPPPPPDAAPVSFEGGAPAAPAGRVDFDAVFEAAGIGGAERDLFAKAAGLLGSLPEADAATRKKIVEASLKAFGIPIDRIIETGAHQIQTLEAYLQEQAGRTKGVAEESQKLIADYEAKIRDVRALLERRIAEQGSVQASCNGKKLEVQRVLEFFGQEEVARVVRESPKLVEPDAAPVPRKD
jgi:hypothetical protein